MYKPEGITLLSACHWVDTYAVPELLTAAYRSTCAHITPETSTILPTAGLSNKKNGRMRHMLAHRQTTHSTAQHSTAQPHYSFSRLNSLHLPAFLTLPRKMWPSSLTNQWLTNVTPLHTYTHASHPAIAANRQRTYDGRTPVHPRRSPVGKGSFCLAGTFQLTKPADRT